MRMNRRIKKKQENRRKIREYDALVAQNTALLVRNATLSNECRHLRDSIVPVAYVQTVNLHEVQDNVRLDGDMAWAAVTESIIDQFGKWLGHYLVENKYVEIYQQEQVEYGPYGPLVTQLKFLTHIKTPGEIVYRSGGTDKNRSGWRTKVDVISR